MVTVVAMHLRWPKGRPPSSVAGGHPGCQARGAQGRPSQPVGLEGIRRGGRIHCDPGQACEFLRFLATREQADAGSARTKMRIGAIGAASRLVGVPSPPGDITVGACRRGVRRVEHAVRGPAHPVFRGETLAADLRLKCPRICSRSREPGDGSLARGSCPWSRSGPGPQRAAI